MEGHTAEQSVTLDLVALLCEKKKSEISASTFTQSENKSCHCLKMGEHSEHAEGNIWAFISWGLESYIMVT